MDKVFCTLHMEGITKENYTKCFESLKFMEGMKEACNFLCSESIPTIIISDSNNWFIHHLLERDSLQEVFSSIYTNPAWWDETGCLHVADHHEHQCNTCPRNLCKRKVLEEHMTCHGQTYKHIVYVGDGNNDLCPCLALKDKDYILAREGYRLLNGLLGARSSEVTAEVIPWVSGFDVLQFFQKLCADWIMNNVIHVIIIILLLLFLNIE